MLYVITGPPCAGKSTWVRDRAKPGDLVIDLDRIALSLTSEDTPHHQYPAHIRALAIKTRSSLIPAALRVSRQLDVYLVHAKPSNKQLGLYLRHHANIIELTASLDVLLARAAQERPSWVAPMIVDWWKEDEQP